MSSRPASSAMALRPAATRRARLRSSRIHSDRQPAIVEVERAANLLEIDRLELAAKIGAELGDALLADVGGKTLSVVFELAHRRVERHGHLLEKGAIIRSHRVTSWK